MHTRYLPDSNPKIHGTRPSGSVAARLLVGATAVAVISGVIGIGVGIGATLAGQNFLPQVGPQYGVPEMSAHAIALAVALSVVIGLVAGALPAWRAARTLGRPRTIASAPLIEAVAG